jgi:repressor LexA
MARRNAGLGIRHRKIMEFLTEFQEEKGYSPSIRQIGKSIKVDSTSLIDYYLNQLEEMEYIERDEHISRSIRILKPVYEAATQGGMSLQRIPNPGEMLVLRLAGRIVASAPMPMPASDLGYYDPESSVEIARSLLPKREKISELFALEVQGDSMIDAMVNDGDIIVVKQVETAENGEMVAVWLNDTNETTLKYFYREGSRVRLQPANPNLGPIYIENPERMRIMGKVVMVIRQVKPPVMPKSSLLH